MLEAKQIQVAYEGAPIINNLSLKINQGEIASILGPNGCGKSTLLKTLSRILKPSRGQILLEGKKIQEIGGKTLAKKIALLSQHNVTPGGITVKELVYYGRLPHKKWYEMRVEEDEQFIQWALKHTGLEGYEERQVASLSGGERQRVWLAMALAQKPQILLLDEPTTYLDISHQLELMELIKEINQNLGITVVMVLHDLNQACEYSDRLIIMKQGEIKGEGVPQKLITKELLQEIYHIQCDIDKNPITNKPRIHPIRTCKSLCPYMG